MKVNFDKPLGKIKMLHAINQPPIANTDVSAFPYLEQAGIPYTRLHDMGFDRLWPRVDIECVFPDLDADENDPANYRFPLTDQLITELVKVGCQPYYNLSPTIENAVGEGYDPLYINPPKDNLKWARICEHIIAHYNEGWANGFHYGIRYWEIWNEPDYGSKECGWPNQQWTGTNEQYFELYTVAAKHLKERFGDSIMVGGYGAVGPIDILTDPEKYNIPKEHVLPYRAENVHRFKFIHEFLAYIQKSGAPLDFFSWHSYNNVERTRYLSRYMRDTLDQYGFADCEMHLNEWNNASQNRQGSDVACAKAAAMLIGMQDSPNDMLMYYDARIVRGGPYAGMFNVLTRKPHTLYYAFKAFNELYKMGTQVECDSERKDVYALAATDGKRQGVMLTNVSDALAILPDPPQDFDVYLIDEDNHLSFAGKTGEKLRIRQFQTVLLIKE